MTFSLAITNITGLHGALTCLKYFHILAHLILPITYKVGSFDIMIPIL